MALINCSQCGECCNDGSLCDECATSIIMNRDYWQEKAQKLQQARESLSAENADLRRQLDLAHSVAIPGDRRIEAAQIAVATANKEADELRRQLAEAKADTERLRKRHAEIVDTLYGKGFEISGWHLNGDLESMDSWFQENDWLCE